jgi:competence protein ComFC
MSSMDLHPTQIAGPWGAGWALDVHVVASDFIGYNSFGHPEFDTKRSELGEKLYQLKYRTNRQQLTPISEAVVGFIHQRMNFEVHLVLAVPPSDETRGFQPILELAKAVAEGLNAEFSSEALKKIRRTEQLKGVDSPLERSKILAGAFQADPAVLDGKQVLVLDDLYRSGATLSAVSVEILRVVPATNLKVIALTRTGRRR